MGIAPYFDKVTASAHQLLNGLGQDALLELLDAHRVAIILDDVAATSHEGRACLDLLVRLLARLYPKLCIVGLAQDAQEHAKQLRRLAEKINPEIDIHEDSSEATVLLVVGKTSPPLAEGELPLWYLGSDSWTAQLSTTAPAGCGGSRVPFGAGVAACLGVANVARHVFQRCACFGEFDAELRVSALTLERGEEGTVGDARSDLGEIHLVGLGAVGNGMLWALSWLDATGRVHLIDHDDIELSNLQRYVMATMVDIGSAKTASAERWLFESPLNTVLHRETWEHFTRALEDWHIDTVAAALDTERDRIEVQASLPRTVFNGWTQRWEAGLSRHPSFLDEQACLACLYMPEHVVPDEDDVIAKALGIPEEHAVVRRLLQLNGAPSLELLGKIAAAKGIAPEVLAPYQGKPLRELYTRAVCGGGVIEFQHENTDVVVEIPMPHQSALAGILLAAEVVAHRSGLRSKRLPVMTQIDLSKPFPAFPHGPRKKAPSSRCICADEDYRTVYSQKYER